MDLGMTSRISRLLVIGTFIASNALTTVAAENGSPKYVIDTFSVKELAEVSGVASTTDGFLFVGDKNTESFGLVAGTNKAFSKNSFVEVFSNKIVDPEAIDVGYSSESATTRFVLGEEENEVYIEGRKSIQLPDGFKSVCGRGAEGLSVRPSSDGKGWEVAVLWEGGFLAQGDDCTRQQAHNAKVLIYSVPFAPDKEHSLTNILTLATRDLHNLKKRNENSGPFEERFRATDLAWYKGNLLVLVATIPTDGKSGGDRSKAFKYAWLQQFDLKGDPIENRTMMLEVIWPEFHRHADSSKNWEALDTILGNGDDPNLLLGWDDNKVKDNDAESEIVTIKPTFE